MSALVVADLHLNSNPRDAYRVRFFKTRLPRTLDQSGASYLILLGDLTDEKDNHGAWLVNVIVEGIAKLSKRCEVIIMRGNHDYIDVSEPFFRFLDLLPNVTYISSASEMNISGVGRCLFLPHTRDHKRDWKEYQGKRKNWDWVFAHNCFAGAVSDSGKQLGGIPLDEIPGKCPVISGDIHRPQKVGERVRYVGAPYAIDFGDADAANPARLLLLNDAGMTDIRAGGVQKRLIEIDAGDKLRRSGVINPGDIVKVRVRVQDRDEWVGCQNAIRDWAQGNEYVLHSIEPLLVERGSGKRERATRSQSVSDDFALVDEFAKRVGIDKPTLRTGQFIMGKSK